MHKYIIAHSHTRSCLYLTRPEIDPETMCSEPSMHTAARGRASRDTRRASKRDVRRGPASGCVHRALERGRRVHRGTMCRQTCGDRFALHPFRHQQGLHFFNVSVQLLNFETFKTLRLTKTALQPRHVPATSETTKPDSVSVCEWCAFDNMI